MHYNISSFVKKFVTVSMMYILFILYPVSNTPSPSVGTSSYSIVLYDFFIIVLKMYYPFFVSVYWAGGRFYDYCMRLRAFFSFYLFIDDDGYCFFLCLWIVRVMIGLKSNTFEIVSFFVFSLFGSLAFSLLLFPNKLWSINSTVLKTIFYVPIFLILLNC